MANPRAFPAHVLDLPFEGYQIQGIDPKKLPFNTQNQGEYYLLLEPIDGLGYNEEHKLWEHAFNTNETVENWRRTGASLPRLEYIPTSPKLILTGKCGYVQASNTTPDLLDNYAPRINKIVEEVNLETLRLIEERNGIRDKIGYINAAHFKKN